MNAERNRLLVVVDPTAEAQPAVQRAAWLAPQLDAQVELFICYYDAYVAGERFYDSPGLVQTRRDILDTLGARLESLAEPLRKAGLDVGTDLRWDKPLHEGIVRKALDCDATMVLKDTHHHHALKRSVFSNTDWNLLRTCPMPLWLVKPRDIAGQPTIAAAVDPLNTHGKPATLDQAILAIARRLQSATGGDLHVVHSFDPMPAIAGAAPGVATPISVPADDISEELERHHSKALDALIYGQDVDDAHVHLLRGPARQVVPDYASEAGVDVMVMGSIARGALRRAFLGSTAEQVLDQLPCDVLAVKPEGFETPVSREERADG